MTGSLRYQFYFISEKYNFATIFLFFYGPIKYLLTRIAHIKSSIEAFMRKKGVLQNQFPK